MTWLLDTNVFIHLRKGTPQIVQHLNDVWRQGAVVTSVMVVGELIYGAERSVRRDANLTAIDKQIALLDQVILIDPAVARRFGQLKAHLAGRGRMKDDADRRHRDRERRHPRDLRQGVARRRHPRPAG